MPNKIFGRELALSGLLLFLLLTSAYAIPPGYERPQPAASSIEETEAPAVGTILKPQATGTFGLCETGNFNYSNFGGSDCWGWTSPAGTEYAIMGVHDGVAFVNVTTMQQVQTVPGPINGCSGIRWRDMVTYQNYCYVVSECSGQNQGMMIIDMQFLPDSVHLVKSYTTPTNITSHNMSIDTAKGYAYVCVSAGNGFRIIDLSDPENPVDLNSIGTSDIHDVFARNDTVYVAEGNRSSYSIWDVSNKTSPSLLARFTTPTGGYAHNIWPTGDGTVCATTEETALRTIKFWDISDLQNIQLLGEYLAPSQLAHNAQFVGDTMYVSHYESGIAVVDISDPVSPVELFQFDSWTSSESPSFNGAWGVFPHTASGNVYVSNDYGRLNILQSVNVALGEGLVGDSIVGQPGWQVQVFISVDNEVPLRQLTIPFNWAGDLNLSLSSVSTAGLRTEYWSGFDFLVFDPTHFREAVRISAGPTQADLPPGSGPVLSLIFTIPFGASGAPNPISLAPINGISAKVKTDCFEFVPAIVDGWVALPTSNNGCCNGTVGNVDDLPGEVVDIGDLTKLIDFLFISQVPPNCMEEANIDGSANGVVDIGDLTELISYLFISQGTLLNCP